MIEKLIRKKWSLITKLYYQRIFGTIGVNSIIFKPLQINNAKGICILDDVSIYHHSWLMCVDASKIEAIKMENGVTIGHFAHIIAMNSVLIEEDVLIADKVFISDCTHSYEDIDIPIIKQEVKKLSPVVIGEGSWLGENVCVCGASIGKHCIIGANSVVTRDIPDYCVAVGSPARVVKRYDFEKNEWVKV